MITEDNGAELHINYLQESDFSGVDVTGQWSFYPGISGIWGALRFGDLSLDPPTASYILGYVPPPLRQGDCRTIRVVAEGYDVLLNRSRYCTSTDSDAADAATPLGTALAERMEKYANSTSHGAIKVFAKALVFWSSGVLSLTKTTSEPSGPMPPAAGFTYVVEVHDSMHRRQYRLLRNSIYRQRHGITLAQVMQRSICWESSTKQTAKLLVVSVIHIYAPPYPLF